MNNKQDLLCINETKKLLDECYKFMDNIENQFNLLMKEKEPFFNKLENIKIDKPDSNKFSANDLYYLNDQSEKIKDLYKTINERIENKLEKIKEEIPIRIYRILTVFEDKINNLIAEYSNEDNSSKKEQYDMSLSDSFDASSDFNYFYLSPNSSYHQKNDENLEKMIPENIDPIEKNSNSGNMNFNSSQEKSDSRAPQGSLFMCSDHPDKQAEYVCKDHCQKKFCYDCFKIIGYNSEHGSIIKINERINRDSNSNLSKRKDNFLIWITAFFKHLFKKCSDLLNTNRIPNLQSYQDANIVELNDQKIFLQKIFEEYNKIEILSKEDKQPNEQMLGLLKNITLSNRIILQSGTINTNIYEKIDENTKFFISIIPLRNINNLKQLSKDISGLLDEDFTELKKNIIIQENYVILIVNEKIGERNYNKNIFITEETDVKNAIYTLNNIYNLKKKYLIENCQINANNLDKRYDAIYFKPEEDDIIEDEKYFPPIGWFGIGLKNVKDPNWPIAYLTFNNKFNGNQLKIILNEIIEKKNLYKLEYQSKKKEFDKRHWAIVGKGIYLFPNIETAEKYTGTFNIDNKKYKIVLLVKVEKNYIKEPKINKLGCWVVEKEHFKICRILFKEIKNA